MIKIPNSEKRFIQPNNSDLFGNLHYTKNINFDEEGYLKLSPRSVNIIDATFNTNFNIPLAFGRQQSGAFYIPTTDESFKVQIDNSTTTSLQDADNGGVAVPTCSFDTHAVWWQNRWYVTNNTELNYKTPASGDWTNVGITALTSGYMHALEVFRNKQSLCISNGNTVRLYDTTHTLTLTLTIPSDYEIISIKYNNNKVAVITKLSDTVAGQNSNAFFFLWDGATTSAGQGFDIGSDGIVGIIAYKSSWVVLTRTGQVLYFNGGGFEEIFSLQTYYQNKTWGDSINRESFGDLMVVDGSNIYFNINNSLKPFGSKDEVYIPSQPGGVLCYDPKVGLHHKFSPSISEATFLTVGSADINTTSNIFTRTSGYLHTGAIPATGNPIKYLYDSTAPIGGLSTGMVYFIIKHTTNTFSLASTYQDAIDGNKIDITSTGATVNTFMALNVVDYGATRMARTGGIGLVEMNTHALDTMIFGGEYYQKTAVGDIEYLCSIIIGFKNIGYAVTAKVLSNEINDVYQKLYIKYRPLKPTDSIIVKEKTKDIIGLPVTTPQASTHCTWSDSNTFTTTADLSEAYTYINTTGGECEVEIISGSGAGQLSRVSSMSYSAPTYTVNLEETVDGVSTSDVCDVVIENWKVIGTITSADVDGYVELASGTVSKWAKYKLELRGDNVTIEEIQIVNTPFKASK